MKKNDTVEAEKILKVTSEELFDFKKKFGWLENSGKKDEDFEKEKFEIEEIFSRRMKKCSEISVETVQRMLHVGYEKSSKFIEVLSIKNIVENGNRIGLKVVLNKSKLIKEAVRFFAPIIRDRKKLNEMNKYEIFAYVVNGNFDASKVDYFWLNRLISEHFVKDEKYVKTLDDIFGTRLSKVKDLNRRAMSVLSEGKIDFSILAIVTLQYFAEKLKHETLKNCDYMNKNFKEKIRDLRFFEYEY